LRYRGGIDNFLANLDAQRSLYAARRQEVTVRQAMLENMVELYRAVGADTFAGEARP
jgi:multidrug efflux system outer membrane protein